ncbi:MAG TPA: hypothetical protein VHQ47_02225 [Phycisphaerae bacterium]|nr:hypothetical protein [Phycisphaerae bacterium]
MASRHTTTRLSTLLGPRALAVLSCALALIAVQPAIASPAPAPLAKVASLQLPGPVTPAEAAPLTDRRLPARSVAAASYLATRRLHILATLEILHRLIAVELQPPVLQTIPAFLSPPELLVETPPTLPPRRIPLQRGPPATFSQERAFLLTHTLLPPPLA